MCRRKYKELNRGCQGLLRMHDEMTVWLHKLRLHNNWLYRHMYVHVYALSMHAAGEFI
jgi:hypothetical protein